MTLRVFAENKTTVLQNKEIRWHLKTQQLITTAFLKGKFCTKIKKDPPRKI